MNETLALDEINRLIEPKGTHLLANDQWKEDFLNLIQGADIGQFCLKGEKFNIYGLPFFNTDKPQERQNFELQFEQVTGVATTNRM